jgi:hypothetical protein
MDADYRGIDQFGDAAPAAPAPACRFCANIVDTGFGGPNDDLFVPDACRHVLVPFPVSLCLGCAPATWSSARRHLLFDEGAPAWGESSSPQPSVRPGE